MHRKPRRTSTGGAQRTDRRRKQISRQSREQNRRPDMGGGQLDELGIIQGQNGEQGNTIEPRNVQHEGDVAH